MWDEQEPAGTGGSNNTLADAERITTFGTAKSENNVVRILGENADLPGGTTTALPPVAEDNGSIPLAGDTGLTGAAGARTTTGTLGDGPHAATDDFDFCAVDVDAGLSLVADTSGSASGVDTIAAVYDAEGELLAADDDGGTTPLHSTVTWTAETTGTYYVLVAGYSDDGPLPADPFDSASGAGGADTGAYTLGVEVERVDRDRYAVQLRPGDVVGGVSQGAADSLTVYRPDGTQMVGSEGLDASSLYPANSPLPGGGGTTVACVAEEAGWYVLAVDGAVGDYEVQLEGYRPGAQLDANKKQTV